MKHAFLFLLIFCCRPVFAEMMTVTSGDIDDTCLKVKNSLKLSAEDKTSILKTINCESQLSEVQAYMQLNRQKSLLEGVKKNIKNSLEINDTATLCVVGDDDFMFVMNNLEIEYVVNAINSNPLKGSTQLSHCAVIETVE